MSFSFREVDADFHSRKKGKTPSLFKQPVDISKVNRSIIEEWIGQTMQEQLPDDDVAVEFVCELLFGQEQPDIAAVQEQLTTFLNALESRKFCEELWKLLLSAQKDKDGIPEQLLEKRKKKMEQQQNIQQEANRMLGQIRRLGPEKRSLPQQSAKWGAERAGNTPGNKVRKKPVYARDHKAKTNYNRSAIGLKKGD